MNERNRVQRKFENMLKKIGQAQFDSGHIKYKVDKVESVVSWKRQFQDESTIIITYSGSLTSE